MPKLTVARALTARVAQRFVRIATVLVFVAFSLITLITACLAYSFSAWWWLLLIPFVAILIVFLLVRLVVVMIVRRIHSEHMTKQQRSALDEFIDKIQAIIEARGIPLPFVVAICLKDIVVHRDITTIKKLVKDTAGLRREYHELEKLF